MPNIEALEQLKRVVRDAPDHRFDMSTLESKGPCGTIHCAAGWMHEDRWFRENTNILECFEHERGRIESCSSWKLANLFDVEQDDIKILFALECPLNDPHYADIPKSEVIDNIDSLITDGSAMPYIYDEDEDEESDDA